MADAGTAASPSYFLTLLNERMHWSITLSASHSPCMYVRATSKGQFLQLYSDGLEGFAISGAKQRITGGRFITSRY